eukprot:176682_1
MSTKMEVEQTDVTTQNEVDDSSNRDTSSQLSDASTAEVLEKYKTAGIISNRTLHHVLSSCRPGMKIVDLCRLGDDMMTQETNKVYETLKTGVKKGICFPTCISVNEIAGHNSPFSDDLRTLHYGDMVKIDLGCHIDGFCAVVAHTIVLGECKGKKADAIASAWSAAQAALRLLKPNNKNSQITLAIEKSAKTFGANPMDSVLSHEMRQYVIDHENTIICKESPERKVAEFEFEAHQVFGIDIMMSSGRGKAVDRGERCTIYKRNVEVEYPLKMKTSRELLKMINKQQPTFPFTMRNFEANRSRLGITECLRTNIVQPYPILSEKHGEYVSQFKFTVIVSDAGAIQITGLPLNMADIHPSKSGQIQDDELNALLSEKFTGALPAFYEQIDTPKYDDALMNVTAQKQNKPKQNQRKSKGKGKGGQKKSKTNQKKGNKQQRNNQNKNKKKHQNKTNKSKRNQNKSRSNANSNQNKKQNQNQSTAPAMDMDLD